jgi:5-epimerase
MSTTTAATRTHRRLTVRGAWTTTPPVHHDDRGFFVSTYVDTEHTAIGGRPLFPVQQMSFSRSAVGVVRGIHYTCPPTGSEKYVYCSSGAVLDIAVDLRVGSPTFGSWDCVHLEADTGQAVYLPRGVGHAFVALTEGARMTYLLSARYSVADELAISVADPRIGVVLPDVPGGGRRPALSARDAAAPTLAAAHSLGLLPTYDGAADDQLEELR